MKKNKSFDCVEFQRKVRLENYLKANGDFDLMIANMKNSLNDNDLYKYFMKRKYDAEKLKTS